MRRCHFVAGSVLLAGAILAACASDETSAGAGEPESDGGILPEAVLVLDGDCANVGIVTWEDEEWVIDEVAPREWWELESVGGRIVISSNGYEGRFEDEVGNDVAVLGRLEQLDFEVEQQIECVEYK